MFRELEFSFAPFVCVALVILCSLCVLIDGASRYELPREEAYWRQPDGSKILVTDVTP